MGDSRMRSEVSGMIDITNSDSRFSHECFSCQGDVHDSPQQSSHFNRSEKDTQNMVVSWLLAVVMPSQSIRILRQSSSPNQITHSGRNMTQFTNNSSPKSLKNATNGRFSKHLR